MAALPRVAIVGGGFAGLLAARALAGEPVEVVLVDRENHHLFQPLLYQVATAALSPADIARPIRSILRRQANCRVLLGEVVAVSAAGRTLRLADGEVLGYDYLILATGVRHSYFGDPRLERLAPGLKTLDDALEMRRRILLAYEAAEREPEAERRREWLTFVVVGGGPTGVELAGALAEIGRHTLSRDFRRADPRESRVVLVEGRDRLLAAYPEELSRECERALGRIGVEVRLRATVTGIDERGVSLGGGERVAARTVLWAAGIEASPLGRALGLPLDRAGRVKVGEDLGVPGLPGVFVAGDLAAIDGVPGVAPAAMQMGRHAARNVARAVRGEPPLPFRYADRGSVATIGRAAAVADLGRLRLKGLAAWLFWLLIHIFFLIGFRNRVLVLLGWAWLYLSWERGARLIVGRGEPRPGDG